MILLKLYNSPLMSTAHIGPPGVRLEAEDKAVLVYITRPGQGANMWARENFSFRYRIVIWQKSSGATVSFYFTLV